MSKKNKTDNNTIAQNRKARFEYTIEEINNHNNAWNFIYMLSKIYHTK